MRRPEEWMTQSRVIGQKFARLTIISIEASEAGKHPTALCHCECGGWKKARLSNVVQGRTRSCGCLARERFA